MFSTTCCPTTGASGPAVADSQRLDVPRGRTRRLGSFLRLHPDAVGQFAEGIARFLGTGRFLAVQTIIVIVWITLNVAAVRLRWDPYPFILLNLAFSTQAAYAAPLILLAQTRQADRDRVQAMISAKHRDQLSDNEVRLLQENTELTRQVARLSEEIDKLTRSIRERLVRPSG